MSQPGDWPALDNVGQSLTEAKQCMDAATSAAKSALRDAVKHGISESEAARILGVNRLTVRSWLGKL
jgi:DNA-directed RNA polymerase specialized sigma24 family protein